MQTFLPFADYKEVAKCLDNRRLNSQVNEAIVIIRSNLGVYAPSKRSGIIGWAAHPASLMWRGCELQLAKYALTLANERLYQRPLSLAAAADSLVSRRTAVAKWQGLIKEFEDRDYPDNVPVLLGDEEFHSAFRALLLYKDCQATTFERYKAGFYPPHAVIRNLLPKKASWKREDFENIWEYFGRPDPTWYGQWGWEEEPDPDRVFYSTDRVPYIEYRKRRKKEQPHPPFFMPRT